MDYFGKVYARDEICLLRHVRTPTQYLKELVEAFQDPLTVLQFHTLDVGRYPSNEIHTMVNLIVVEFARNAGTIS